MDKEEILKEIKKTKQHLTDLEQMLEKCGCERWKPEPNEEYYYVNQVSEAFKDRNDEDDVDVRRYKAYNCFRTKEQADLEAEKILVRRQLEDIARRLNKGNKIDYEDKAQCKFCIVYDIVKDRIEIDSDYNYVRIGAVHCLNMKFLDVAIQEIGEERLKRYMRGE